MKRDIAKNIGSVLLVALAGAGLLFGQGLSQSGGTGNITAISGSSITLGSKTSSSSLPVVIASDQAAIPASQSGTWNVTVNAALPAGGNTIGNVGLTGSLPALAAGANLIGYTRAPNACSTTYYESGMQYMPNSLTALVGANTCVSFLILNNVTSSNVTITAFQDQSTACNSAACQAFASFVLPGNSPLAIDLHGMKFTGGIKWQAGTANAVMADVIGNQ